MGFRKALHILDNAKSFARSFSNETNEILINQAENENREFHIIIQQRPNILLIESYSISLLQLLVLKRINNINVL